jgi:hypothetical protein
MLVQVPGTHYTHYRRSKTSLDFGLRLSVEWSVAFQCARLFPTRETVAEQSSTPPPETRKFGRKESYCLIATNWLVVPCSLSSTAMVSFLPSADSALRWTLITLPSRLSVSSSVFLSTSFTETLVVPGSPL